MKKNWTSTITLLLLGSISLVSAGEAWVLTLEYKNGQVSLLNKQKTEALLKKSRKTLTSADYQNNHTSEFGFVLKNRAGEIIKTFEGPLPGKVHADFTSENNPLECNLEKFCTKDNSHNFIGKNALNKIREVGIKQKIRGIIFDGGPCPTCAKPFPVFKGKIKIGQITSGICSPRIKKNVGLSMILKDYWNIDEEVKVLTSDNMMRTGVITSLPFPK